MNPQPTLFGDDDEARRAREDGIARADLHADIRWKAAARDALRWCADIYGEFTADQVWMRLNSVAGDVSTHEPSALGPIFMWGARQGLIEKTGYVRPSSFARRHRDLTVWRGKTS